MGTKKSPLFHKVPDRVIIPPHKDPKSFFVSCLAEGTRNSSDAVGSYTRPLFSSIDSVPDRCWAMGDRQKEDFHRGVLEELLNICLVVKSKPSVISTFAQTYETISRIAAVLCRDVRFFYTDSEDEEFKALMRLAVVFISLKSLRSLYASATEYGLCSGGFNVPGLVFMTALSEIFTGSSMRYHKADSLDVTTTLYDIESAMRRIPILATETSGVDLGLCMVAGISHSSSNPDGTLDRFLETYKLLGRMLLCVVHSRGVHDIPKFMDMLHRYPPILPFVNLESLTKEYKLALNGNGKPFEMRFPYIPRERVVNLERLLPYIP